MGRKKTEETEAPKEAKEAKEAKKEEEAVEDEMDTPVVKTLKEIDDRYLAVERDHQKEYDELCHRKQLAQRTFLEQRKQLLVADPSGGSTAGTPALEGFWRKAMMNCLDLEALIEPHDVPVLDYLCDITTESRVGSGNREGFTLTFHFKENPYFTNSELKKEVKVEETCPYRDEAECTEIICTEIDWKAGKNVTIQTVSKKVKGGGAKKAKQKGKTTEEPQESFFRNMFRPCEKGMDLPEDLDLEELRELREDVDDDEMVKRLMDNELELASIVRDQVIPFAVRWYTGEAAPDEDGDDEESEEDDEDDESSDEDESPVKAKGGKKKIAEGAKPKSEEECKQQ